MKHTYTARTVYVIQFTLHLIWTLWFASYAVYFFFVIKKWEWVLFLILAVIWCCLVFDYRTLWLERFIWNYRERALCESEIAAYRQAVTKIQDNSKIARRFKAYKHGWLTRLEAEYYLMVKTMPDYFDYLDRQRESGSIRESQYWIYRSKAAYLSNDKAEALNSLKAFDNLQLYHPFGLNDTTKYGANKYAVTAMRIELEESYQEETKMSRAMGLSNLIWKGVYYYNLGDYDRAREILRDLISQGRDYNDVKLAKELLQDNDDEVPKYPYSSRKEVVMCVFQALHLIVFTVLIQAALRFGVI